MKTRYWSVGIVLLGCIAALGCVTYSGYPQTIPMGGQAAPAPVVDNGSDQPFYDDLAPHGRWVYVSGPGWVWSPYGVQADWRPYQMGHWVFTDYGWTWSSDEQWGWAVYHYGRWHQDPSHGWVWVPGTEWGPAWVAWNEGGGYVGWAPLPWQVRVQAGVGITGASLNVSIAPAWWCFVSARNLVDVSLRTHIVPPSRNVTLIQVTKNVTNYTYIDNRIVNGGVRVETIGRAVGRTIPRYRVSEAADLAEVTRGNKVKGHDIIMYRPDPRGRRDSRGRTVPPGHSEEMERLRQLRHPNTPQTDAPAPPAAPPQTQNPPQADPPSHQEGDNRGRDDRDRGPKQHDNRGHRILDALTGQKPRGGGRAPQANPPQANPPQAPPPGQPSTPGQPANPPSQSTAPPSQPPAATPNTPPPSARQPVTAQPKSDRAKEIRDAAAKARKPKQDDQKQKDADDEKDKNEKPDSKE